MRLNSQDEIYTELECPKCDFCGRTVRDFNPHCISEGRIHSFHRKPFKVVPDPFYDKPGIKKQEDKQ